MRSPDRMHVFTKNGWSMLLPWNIHQGLRNCIWVWWSELKKISVLINFLLQNTNLVSVIIKICPNFAGHIWQDWQFRELWYMYLSEYWLAVFALFYFHLLARKPKLENFLFIERTSFIIFIYPKPGARVAQWVRSLDLTAHTSLSPIRHGFTPSFVNYKKGALDSQPQVYQLLVQGRWFSPGTPASYTTKTGRHDIA